MRPAAPNAGLRGPAREHFPASVQEQARALALTGVCNVLRQGIRVDGAGGSSADWDIAAWDVPCRLDPVGVGGGGPATVADQLNESPSHALTVPAGTGLRTSDRVVTEGRTWTLVGLRDRTDDLVETAEVREA